MARNLNPILTRRPIGAMRAQIHCKWGCGGSPESPSSLGIAEIGEAVQLSLARLHWGRRHAGKITAITRDSGDLQAGR